MKRSIKAAAVLLVASLLSAAATPEPQPDGNEAVTMVTTHTNTPVEHPADLPVTVPTAICHGLFGDYLRAVWRQTEADPSAC